MAKKLNLAYRDPFFTTLPSFITNETRSVAVMWAVGSPGMATMLAACAFQRANSLRDA
jgi:hypothetical protein